MGGATPTQLRNAVNILKKRGKRGLMYDEGSPKQVEATKNALRNVGVKVRTLKDGGLMEAIRKVDAEKEQRLQDGGMVGNLTSNFKGNY